MPRHYAAVLFLTTVPLGLQALGFLGLGPPPPLIWIQLAVFEILRTTLWTYFFAIVTYALLSLIAPGTYSPAQGLLVSLCEPVLRQFRRVIPPLGGLDWSPLWACIVIQMLLILLR